MFDRIREPGQWVFNSVVEPEEFEDLDERQAKAVDGFEGGVYAPTDPIDVGGAGLMTNTPEEDRAVPNKKYVDDEVHGNRANIQVFKANGTWTKPTGYHTHVRVICVQAGHVGGSTPAAGHGGGASSGLKLPATFAFSSLPSTVSVTVGTSAGAHSSFGAFLTTNTSDSSGNGGSSSSAGNAGGGGGGGGQNGNSGTSGGAPGGARSERRGRGAGGAGGNTSDPGTNGASGDVSNGGGGGGSANNSGGYGGGKLGGQPGYSGSGFGAGGAGLNSGGPGSSGGGGGGWDDLPGVLDSELPTSEQSTAGRPGIVVVVCYRAP